MIYRIDIRTAAAAREGKAAIDPVGEAVRQQIREFGTAVGPISTSRIFLIDTDSAREQIADAANRLLADPIVESAEMADTFEDDNDHSRIEIHLKAGVMDPVAASTEMALRDLGINVREVRTGRAYLIEGHIPRVELERIASRVLANGVIEAVHYSAFVPRQFERGREDRFELRHIPLRQLTDTQLVKLSREGHLFLSLGEMKAAQSYFAQQGREPTDVELETLAQTWSEHCVHKTLKSAVDVDVHEAAGQVVSTRHYRNLIKETIFASTKQVMERGSPSAPSIPLSLIPSVPPAFCLSVFVDNAGVIAFDETDAVCFKVETHNHPSAIEPYGGSATGIGGVIRDILGTGLGARPIANTDIFCVAFPDLDRRGPSNPSISAPSSSSVPASLPKGVIHPKRVLQQIVAGVRDYGNRMGIPTVNGAVYFDDRYLGNPLVFCGCVGLIPRDKIKKQTVFGDAIVVMGGRTGRDGIHGATFSSAELTDTHADEFSHAVQIGNAITEKKVADVILQARDRNLFTAITDCGAGGLSSAVGEMGETLGASVALDKVPLKYAGLRYDEIWISEAQERMVLSVPPEHLEAVLKLAASENVEANVIGQFGTEKHELVLSYRDQEVARMSMEFVHHGIPMPTRKAVVAEIDTSGRKLARASAHGYEGDLKAELLRQLAHPNIASKHWIIRQYDHEVQGGSVIKPLTGPLQIGPSDAAVVRPKLDSYRGVALGCGLAPQIEDPYQMSLAAIDESIRNVVAVGADPNRIAILDNFCWPSVDDEKAMGSLVRACEACRDAALAYGIPFISGKDSLHNQFTNSETGQVIRIPNTLLISAIGVIEDVRKCVTMDLKSNDSTLLLIGPPPNATLEQLRQAHQRLAENIASGRILSCHDVSEGGVLVAAAEMCIASGRGLIVAGKTHPVAPFEMPSGFYLVEVQPEHRTLPGFSDSADRLICHQYARVTANPELTLPNEQRVSIDDLTAAWRGTLDW